MKISDIIEDVIKELLEQTEGVAEFQRNELAGRLNCVPSQINYVINSRFTNNHGYIVESRRGGGGSIIIKRIKMGKSEYLMHIISSMGNVISQSMALTFIQNFLDYGSIGSLEAKLMVAAVTSKGLTRLQQPLQDTLRADIFKNMIISILCENS